MAARDLDAGGWLAGSTKAEVGGRNDGYGYCSQVMSKTNVGVYTPF